MNIKLALAALLGICCAVTSTFPSAAQTDGNTSKQKTDSIALTGKVFDRLTSHHLVGTTVEVLNPDSSLISRTTGGERFNNYIRKNGRFDIRRDSISDYSVNAPKREGNYIIKVSKEGYEPYYLSYFLQFKKRDFKKEIPNIYLGRQKVTTLQDFTVKASKVKFYHKGDTIVYNADAFALPEGSMLDALVAQLPGVTIKDNKIYVNGQFVESLLLNGKDFFKNNKSVMMKNIGAYAVKDVAVYEKADEQAYVLGDERQDLEKQLVMDVRLKKDYMTGYMINADAGIGTDSRYLGRLFALQYTNNSRLALYGNTNNVNIRENLSDSPYEIYTYTDNGITKRINGGMDYNLDNTMHTWEASGNVDATYKDNKTDVVTNAVNYLQTADTYDFSDKRSMARDFSLSTEHDFKIKKKKWNMSLKPKFSYNKTRNNDETTAATFDKEMQDLNKVIIEAIYSSDYRTLRQALLNRNLKLYESNEHGYKATFNGDARFKVPGTPDGIVFKLQAKYSRSSNFTNTHQDICFGSLPNYSQLLDRNSAERPHYSLNLQALARYYFNVPVGSLNLSYEFAHTQTRKNSDVMFMEAFANDGMAEYAPEAGFQPDFANSYTSKLFKNEHRIKVIWGFKKDYERGSLKMDFQPNFIFEGQHLFYTRGSVNASPSRSYLKFNIPVAKIEWRSKDKKQRYYAYYELEQKPVSLVNTVDIRNDYDPLNIILGNPDLKNATQNRINAIAIFETKNFLSNYLSFHADWVRNDMVMGYRYDTATGVRTSKTYNVSGNYNLDLRYDISYDFGREKRFSIENNIFGTLSRYANMIGNDAEPAKQTVMERGIHEYLRIGYTNRKVGSLSISGTFRYKHTNASDINPVKTNYGYAGAIMNGWLNLPYHFHISSDLYAMKRYGYMESSMNRWEFMWNAELIYSIKNDSWQFKLRANDILNQNKDIQYTVDASGSKQTLTTVLPRYLMLIVHYRFDFKPKRKHK